MVRNFIESGRIWIVAVIGLLALNVTVCAVTVVAATKDPVASAVEPDYYQRAVEWDQTRAAWPPPDRVGWSLRAEQTADGRVVFDLGLTDHTGAAGRLEARHAGDTLETVSAPLAVRPDGRLVWNAADVSPGMWTVTLWIERDGVRATDTLRLMIEG